MARSVKIAVALFCLLCVLALCIAPSVDIPATILKSLQVAFLLMVALVGSGLLLVDSYIVYLKLIQYAVARTRETAFVLPLMLPIETNCVQQC